MPICCCGEVCRVCFIQRYSGYYSTHETDKHVSFVSFAITVERLSASHDFPGLLPVYADHWPGVHASSKPG